MFNEPLNPPRLPGTKPTAEVIKAWLIDKKKTLSGLVGVNDDLQIVSVRTFQHALSQPALEFALNEARRAEARGVVAYSVAQSDTTSPQIDRHIVQYLMEKSESLDITLLDIMFFSRNGWQSARQANLL